jgi:predicted RNA-binding Zn-ribbon protein involved in translation (DUF1610 family)
VNDQTSDNQRAARRRKSALLVVICVAVLAVVGYNYWSGRARQVTPLTRTLLDFQVTWRCLECGHELEDRGAVGTRTCPQCGAAQMYVSIRHGCPQHGVFPVAFEYDEAGDPVRIKVADADWVPYLDEDYNINARCPKCGASMMPAEQVRPAAGGPP